MTRAAAYARVSTQRQVDEGSSLQAQRTNLPNYVAAQGWELVATFEDAGVSGVAASRPAFDRMLAAVRRRELDVIVVHSLSRFGRSMAQTVAALAVLDEHNVRLVSVTEGFDSATPAGRLHRNLMSSIAEFEREQTLDRTLGGLVAVAADGRWPGGPAPFGLRLDRRAGRRGVLEINPDEVRVIEVFVAAIVDEGLSSWQTARVLNDAGLTPRRGGLWAHHQLRTLMRRATHLGGTAVWRGQPIPVPAILEAERFEAFRAALAATATARPDRVAQYPLARRIRSAHDEPMHGVFRKDRGTRVYRCGSRRHDSNEPICDCQNVSAPVVERLVVAALRDVFDDTLIERMAGRAHETAGDREAATAESAVALERKIARSEKAAASALADLLAAGVDAAVAAGAQAEMFDKLTALRARHRQVIGWERAAAASVVAARTLADAVDDIRANLSNPSTDMLTTMMALLDVRVTVTGSVPCATCGGTGVEPVPVVPAADGTGFRGTSTAVACPTCLHHGTIPTLALTCALPLPEAAPVELQAVI